MKVQGGKVFRVLKTPRQGRTPKVEVEITCGCGQTGRIPLRGRLSAGGASTRFQQKGWQVDPEGSVAQCEECKRMKNGSPVEAQTQAATVAQVQALRLLMDHFDADQGRFEDGWSDDKIAETVGVAPEAVMKWREAGFGALAASPELLEIGRRIGVLKDQLTEEIDGARELFSSTFKSYSERIAALQLQFDELTRGMKRAA